jgi:putative endonuclease
LSDFSSLSRNLPHLSNNRRNILGQRGEELAATYLQDSGYRILERNYRNYYGEIDIIALHISGQAKTLVFVEVKTRKNDRFSHPSEAVTRKKQLQISKVALEYLEKNKLAEVAARFDVVAILLPDNGPPLIELIPNAFDLSDGF